MGQKHLMSKVALCNALRRYITYVLQHHVTKHIETYNSMLYDMYVSCIMFCIML
jgi:hypothetical protein